MKARAKAIFLLILTGLVSSNARADGKFYWIRESVPPDVPYQRAFLLFDEGTETLVVQSKYELTQSAESDSLAWVVPVPSIPDLANVDTLTADRFFLHLSYLARVGIRRVSNIFPLVSVAAFFVGIALGNGK